jgi:2-dehydropantoate 2-reductase
MKHAILGAGAIGGLLGTALASVGEDVTMIVRPEKLAGFPETLTLKRPSGTITAPARAVAKLTGTGDVLWIATKAFQLPLALGSIETVPTLVIPLLNGTEHVSQLRERFGQDHVVPGTITIESENAAPGVSIQLGPVVRLNLGASAEPLLGKTIAKLGDLGFTSQFVPNEQTLLWSKLCFLGPLALVTSASGKNKGEVFADAGWKGVIEAAVQEACAVAKSQAAEVDPSVILGLMQSLPPSMRSSMQKDAAAGRPLELDAIGGAIVRGGEKAALLSRQVNG